MEWELQLLESMYTHTISIALLFGIAVFLFSSVRGIPVFPCLRRECLDMERAVFHKVKRAYVRRCPVISSRLYLHFQRIKMAADRTDSSLCLIY